MIAPVFKMLYHQGTLAPLVLLWRNPSTSVRDPECMTKDLGCTQFIGGIGPYRRELVFKAPAPKYGEK